MKIGIEWLPLASMGLLREASALATDLGTGVHIHLNESMGEVQSSLEKCCRTHSCAPGTAERPMTHGAGGSHGG